MLSIPDSMLRPLGFNQRKNDILVVGGERCIALSECKGGKRNEAARHLVCPLGRFDFTNEIQPGSGAAVFANRRVLLHGTRRLDVDTKWMAKQGVEASKDYLSVKDNERLRNYLEDKWGDIGLKSQKFAEKILP